YKNCNRRGIIAINIEEGDELIAVHQTTGHNEIVLISDDGRSARFDEEQVRSTGRASIGVKGMNLDRADEGAGARAVVRSMTLVDPACTLLVAASNGIGKRTPYDDEDGHVFRKTSRGAKGVIAIKLKEGTTVAGALSVRDDDEVMLLTQAGQAIRTRAKEIRTTGRNAQGVKLMNLAAGESIIGISRVVRTDEDTEAAKDTTGADGE
ncbi:MAG: DNA gyrase subunit A, partial [Puniceicoccales bacterium]|nr:DNA gyrase subunit A [Puniceicoccales bacterium]